MSTTETLDLSTFTVEQLQEALQKRGAKPSPEDSEKKDVAAIKNKCSFAPTRANQPACSEESTVHYGPHAYCKKHCRTVQALNAKKSWEESNVKSVPSFSPETNVETPSLDVKSQDRETPPKKQIEAVSETKI